MTTYQRQRQPFAAHGRRGLPKTTAQDHDMTRNQRLDNEYNNNQSMSNKPTSILKKTPSKKQPPQQYQNGWQPTSYRSNQDTTHIDFIPSRPLYSPVSTPPRLRALITPPGIEPYRNRYNLRLFTSPLPSLDDWQPPLSLDTWGIDPVDYRFNNPNLYRLQPSPLSHYGLPGSKQKKSYIVVPRLQNVSSATMSRQNSSKFKPDPRYPYLETTASAKSTRLLRVSNSNAA
ncbi:unnamed protein product [Didymodactylos carnosus]|uniref:Uncharacterized protein n=1 Tax=Didymodactylos carnosus TaxID=1234261 RepID=A0A8S2Q699_9BILA|nr:unnamed protein product [Didymodactylos carnosus]CAF4086820.1 unnamed protein product [Didymodactylos carnosus]